MAHDALVRNVSMSLGATESAISISAVQHCHNNLMHTFQYSICLRVFDSGRLMLNTI